ncbi:hypothetical protein BDQ17DRAFT_1544086 [Cyathus striatus]|nr:hypothetical protein BDQ17DRAFT_1544086 [Cyathus striatus]
MPATTIHFLDEEMYYDDNDDGRERYCLFLLSSFPFLLHLILSLIPRSYLLSFINHHTNPFTRTKYRSPTIPASKLFNSSTTSGKQKQKQPQAYADEINVLPEGYDPYTPPDGFPFPIQPPLAPPPAGERVYMPEPETETERRQGVDRAYTQSVPLERRDKSHSGSSGSGSGSGSGRGEGEREGEGTGGGTVCLGLMLDLLVGQEGAGREAVLRR